MTISRAILSTVTIKAGFARFMAIMLVAALLSPTFFFGDFGRVSAKSGGSIPAEAAPASAPPEPFVFSAPDGLTTVLASELAT